MWQHGVAPLVAAVPWLGGAGGGGQGRAPCPALVRLAAAGAAAVAVALLGGEPVPVEGAACVLLLRHRHLVERAKARLLVVWLGRAGGRAIARRRWRRRT